MTQDKLKEILQKGEGIEIEFKTSQFELNRDAFESICAFLNRKGGHLLLGVKNDGTVEGVIEGCVKDIVNNIVTNANNPQKLRPPFYLSTQVIDYEGEKVIYVYVPESSQVHNTNGKIFDRNEDGDFDITQQTEQVTQLYLRKQTTYSENRIYPYLKLSDFKPELFSRVRTLAKNERSDHPWQDMSDEELLRSAGLFKHDHKTGKDGYTLAAVLLLGKDEVIQSVLPHHKTDAILRVENIDRYDDRDDIRTNLIESYDRLMAFVRKHLPDKFSPYPKNPVIAKFFKEIGRVDELGSGVRNTFKYCGIYTPGTKPEFIEEDVFTTVIPLNAKEGKEAISVSNWEEVRRNVRRKFGEKFGESSEKIVEMIFENQYISASEMAKVIGITERAVEKQLAKLKDRDIIDRIGPDKGGHWKIKV